MILEFKNESIIYNAIVISAHKRYFEVTGKKKNEKMKLITVWAYYDYNIIIYYNILLLSPPQKERARL